MWPHTMVVAQVLRWSVLSIGNSSQIGGGGVLVGYLTEASSEVTM